jgi:hypothetical protein
MGNSVSSAAQHQESSSIGLTCVLRGERVLHAQSACTKLAETFGGTFAHILLFSQAPALLYNVWDLCRKLEVQYAG